MAQEEYDLLVIGGGILGCGVARERRDTRLAWYLVEGKTRAMARHRDRRG